MTYTAKGTPSGLDVNNAIDYLQSFNAGWPLLKVDQSSNYSGAVNHNLGYFPFHFMVSTSTPSAVDEFGGVQGTYGVSTTQLLRASGSGSPRYYIFRLNLETNFIAPTFGGDSVPGVSTSDYVFKLSKPGKSSDSSDMRDFSLHSETRSPMVHKVDHGIVTGGGSGRTRTVTHNLGYLPTAFAFVKPGAGSSGLGLTNGMYYLVPPPVGVSAGYYEVSSTQVYVNLDSLYFSASTEVSVVILKDPFNKTVINRTYP